MIGIDPKLIDSSLATTTGWDTNRIQAAAQELNKKLMELGYKVQSCLIDPGGETTAESVVSDTLSREKFDCIMVGAGIRVLPQHTLLFEEIMNTIHQKAPPSSKLCSIPILLTLLKQYSVGHNQHNIWRNLQQEGVFYILSRLYLFPYRDDAAAMTV